MAEDNITPIRGDTKHERCTRFHLDEPDDEPGNLRLIQALHGVCYAIEHLEQDHDVSLELGTAAEILSEMLQNRIGS